MTFEEQRQRMVIDQLIDRGIRDPRVLAALAKVSRQLFVPPAHRDKSYTDHPLPIGAGQTISQPYIVALMTQELALKPHSKVLEVGTGSGYQTAILANVAAQVYSIERIPSLGQGACELLRTLGMTNVEIRLGDGTLGWPEAAPFDGILVTAAAPQVPPTLLDQLADQGRLVLPIGSPVNQELTVVERSGKDLRTRQVCSCVFVPLIGAHGWSEGQADPEEV